MACGLFSYFCIMKIYLFPWHKWVIIKNGNKVNDNNNKKIISFGVSKKKIATGVKQIVNQNIGIDPELLYRASLTPNFHPTIHRII